MTEVLGGLLANLKAVSWRQDSSMGWFRRLPQQKGFVAMIYQLDDGRALLDLPGVDASVCSAMLGGELRASSEELVVGMTV